MKRYRLRKWYPTLPKDWEEGIVLALHNKRKVYVEEHRAESGITGFSVARKEVEENPDFWTKVKENYEVVKVRLNNSDKTIITYKKGEPVHRTDPMPIDKTVPLYQALKNKANDIYSVRRLKDGQIFSIGDLAKNHMDNVEEITGFKSYDGGETLYVCFRVVQSFLENTIHEDQVHLFTTVDGVDIFKGDKSWAVDTVTFEIEPRSPSHYAGDSNRFKYFSTKETAERWITYNKPRYSMKQVDEALKVFTGHANFHKGKFRIRLTSEEREK